MESNDAGVPNADAPPPRPMKAYTDAVHEPHTLTLVRRSRPGCATAFMIIWLIGWSVGCLAMLGKLVTDFEWFFLLFAIPFFTAELVVGGLVLWSCFGRHLLVITPETVTSQWKLFGFARTTTTSTADVREVYEFSGGSNNDQPFYGLRLRTLDQPITIAYELPDDERAWLTHLISTRLASINGDTIASPSRQSVSPSRPMSMLPRRMMPGEPRWRIEDNIRSITLHQRGRTQPLTAAGALAICLFWNGIVGVFVVQLIRDFQWLLALFLVPFVVIGLAIIGVFFFALTNGFRATEWTIDSNELVRYRRGLLLRRTRRWTIGRLMRTTIDDTGTSSQPNQLRLSDGTWRVSLIDNTDTQIAVIDGLTEEQARALNEVILRNLIR